MILGVKNKRFIFVVALLVALITVFLQTSNSDNYNTDALDSNTTNKTITITKIWDKDEESVRPSESDVTVHLENTVSILMAGCPNSSPNCSNSLEQKMKQLAGQGSVNSDNFTVTAIKHATKEEYNAKKSSLTTTNEIQSSGEKTYMWFDNDTLYYYSEASTIYLNSISGGIFRKFRSLSDISGLADLNTSYVTDMNRMFQMNGAMANLDALSTWDTSSVTNMRFILGSNVTSGACVPDMIYEDLNALSNWDVSSVSDFNQAFKCAVKVTSLASLKNWDMSSAKDLGQMFTRLGTDTENGADVLDIKNWDVTAVINTTAGSGGFSQFFNNAFTNRDGDIGTSSGSNPFFLRRPGYWTNNTNGTYVTKTSAITPPSPVSPGTPVQSSYICSGSDWTKSGNTWTCNKTITDDGSNYMVYEDPITDYDGACGGTTCTTSDRGIFDTKNNTYSITNTNKLYKEIDITKQWVGDTVYSGARPTDIVARVLKNGTELKVSDNTKWIKNGDTWTYQFVVYDDSLSGYTISEDTVPRYTTQIPALTIDENTGYGATTITNTLKTHTLTATKKITGNLAEIDKTFDYAINVYDWHNNPVAAFSSSGTWGHNDIVSIAGIPDGFTYEVDESSTSDYKTFFKIDNSTSGAVIQPTTQGLSAVGTLDSSQAVTFINNKERAPDTGVIHDQTPFALIVAIGVGAGVSYISFYFMRKFKPKVRDG